MTYANWHAVCLSHLKCEMACVCVVKAKKNEQNCPIFKTTLVIPTPTVASDCQTYLCYAQYKRVVS